MVESLSSVMARSLCVLFVIFFLLSFSVHACNARNIMLRNAGSAEEFVSCKIGKKVRSTVDSFQSAGTALIGHAQSRKLYWKPKKINGPAEEIKYVPERRSDVVPFRFIILEQSIPWHVPKKKHVKYPGFFSDYSRPRLRPPSHN